MADRLVLRGQTHTTRDQSQPLGSGRVVTRRTFLDGRPTSPVTVTRNTSGLRLTAAPPIIPLTRQTSTRPTNPPKPGGSGGFRPPPPTGLPGMSNPFIGGSPGPQIQPPPIGSIPGAQNEYQFDPGSIVDWGAGFLPDWAQDLVNAGRSAFAGGAGASGTSCPEGYKVDSSGRCVADGIGGAAQRMLPGGSPGQLTTDFGPAVMGAFGKPALVPAQVGTVARKDGTVGPILRCPAGMVLGRDDLCYSKGQITKADRKWKPAAKPPMSAADAKALRRIGTLQKKIKRLAKAGNMSCKRK